MLVISAPVRFSSNRTKHASNAGSKSIEVLVEGPTKDIAMQGVYYFHANVPYGLCTESAYDDIASSALPLATLFITHRYIIRRGDLVLFSETYTRERVVKVGEDVYVDVPISRAMHSENGDFEDVVVAFEIVDVKDQCGREIAISREMIDLTVFWQKLPSNPCIPCLLPKK